MCIINVRQQGNVEQDHLIHRNKQLSLITTKLRSKTQAAEMNILEVLQNLTCKNTVTMMLCK